MFSFATTSSSTTTSATTSSDSCLSGSGQGCIIVSLLFVKGDARYEDGKELTINTVPSSNLCDPGVGFIRFILSDFLVVVNLSSDVLSGLFDFGKCPLIGNCFHRIQSCLVVRLLQVNLLAKCRSTLWLLWEECLCLIEGQAIADCHLLVLPNLLVVLRSNVVCSVESESELVGQWLYLVLNILLQRVNALIDHSLFGNTSGLCLGVLSCRSGSFIS